MKVIKLLLENFLFGENFFLTKKRILLKVFFFKIKIRFSRIEMRRKGMGEGGGEGGHGIHSALPATLLIEATFPLLKHFTIELQFTIEWFQQICMYG